MVLALGTSSCSSSSRFDATSVFKDVMPVTLPPGRVEAGNETDRHGIEAGVEDNRNGRGRRLGCSRAGGVGSNDQGDLALNQVCSQPRNSVMLVIRPPVFNRYILSFDKRGLAQATMKCGHGLPGIAGRFAVEESNDRHLRLLRARRERPRGSGTAE